MSARIYKPAKTAMSSGTAKTNEWILDFVAESARGIDPLMGWTSSDDTHTQIRLRFTSKREALNYAADNGIDAVVTESQSRQPNIRANGYAENFSTARRGTWTH